MISKIFKKKTRVKPDNIYDQIDAEFTKKMDEVLKDLNLEDLFSSSFSDYVEQNKSK